MRIIELDYLKGIMIILVVMFHLMAFDVTYPTLRMAVYTFHVPIFLLVSGYLVNIEKNASVFMSSLLRLVVPYFIFETVYLLLNYSLGSYVNATLSINSLTIQSFFIRLFVYPLGAYWYLHSLIVCSFIYYIVFHFLVSDKVTKFLLVTVVVFVISYLVRKIGWVNIMAGSGFVWESVMYFLLGVMVRLIGVPFTKTIPPNGFAVVPLVLLFSSTDNLYRGTLPGVLISLLVICCLLYVFRHLGSRMQHFFCYLGRNSISIFVFSPFFVAVTKFALPIFNFDTTVICYTILSCSFAIISSLMCALLIDRFHLGKWLFFLERVYIPFSKV